MSNSSDDQGRGGEGKRPYATIELKATEVEPPADTAKPGEDAAKADAAPEAEGSEAHKAEAGAAVPPPRRAMSAAGLLSHLAAGAVGAGLVVLAGEMMRDRDAASRQASLVSEIGKRVSDMEAAIGGRPGAEGLRARLDEAQRGLAALKDAQARTAADARQLEARIGGQDIPPGLAERLTKMDEILATVPTPAGREPSPAAKALITRVDGELSALRTETGRLSQRIDTLRGEIEERLSGAARASELGPLAAKVGAMEKDVQAFTRSEADRNANASRIVLLLELGNLKRAVDSGRPYPSELAAVQKVAQGRVDLKPIERFALEGVPPLADLQRSFRRIATAIIDAEGEPANATLIDRLVNGAKSVVRVRKAGHAADDTSVEAIVGRMETALKESQLGEVMSQGKKLPPKPALVAEDWLKKVEARQAVNVANTQIEQQLKVSLGEAQR
ncbi:MAG: hypothetical protein NW223_22880 [Hyphomicrobiaceae bacterium]|nr:hypothetical protein [Hyphomicrobiaceae bacterium]